MACVPLVFHPHYVAPLRAGHAFPMSKYGFLREILQARGMMAPGRWSPAPLASAEMIGRAHAPDYVARVFARSLSPEEERRIGLPQTEAVVRRARLACGGTTLAAQLALRHGLAANLAGGSHHAGPDYGAGYCVFNDVGVMIRSLQAMGLIRRALVIDCDAHQGDGTAAIFANDPSVFAFSIHGARNYPARKIPGSLDVGLPDGTDDAEYLAALAEALARIVESGFAADLVVYNAGVDVHAGDRLGRLALTDHGIRARDRMAIAWARERGLPLVAVLGGGYGDAPVIAARHAILIEEMGLLSAR